jgi:hypothetical protein
MIKGPYFNAAAIFRSAMASWASTVLTDISSRRETSLYFNPSSLMSEKMSLQRGGSWLIAACIRWRPSASIRMVSGLVSNLIY